MLFLSCSLLSELYDVSKSVIMQSVCFQRKWGIDFWTFYYPLTFLSVLPPSLRPYGMTTQIFPACTESQHNEAEWEAGRAKVWLAWPELSHKKSCCLMCSKEESTARSLILYVLFGNGPIVLNRKKVGLMRHILVVIICSYVTYPHFLKILFAYALNRGPGHCQS